MSTKHAVAWIMMFAVSLGCETTAKGPKEPPTVAPMTVKPNAPKHHESMNWKSETVVSSPSIFNVRIDGDTLYWIEHDETTFHGTLKRLTKGARVPETVMTQNSLVDVQFTKSHIFARGVHTIYRIERNTLKVATVFPPKQQIADMVVSEAGIYIACGSSKNNRGNGPKWDGQLLFLRHGDTKATQLLKLDAVRPMLAGSGSRVVWTGNDGIYELLDGRKKKISVVAPAKAIAFDRDELLVVADGVWRIAEGNASRVGRATLPMALDCGPQIFFTRNLVYAQQKIVETGGLFLVRNNTQVLIADGLSRPTSIAQNIDAVFVVNSDHQKMDQILRFEIPSKSQ